MSEIHIYWELLGFLSSNTQAFLLCKIVLILVFYSLSNRISLSVPSLTTLNIFSYLQASHTCILICVSSYLLLPFPFILVESIFLNYSNLHSLPIFPHSSPSPFLSLFFIFLPFCFHKFSSPF